MAELHPHARANLQTKTARDTARQTNADQVQPDLDAEKQVAILAAILPGCT